MKLQIPIWPPNSCDNIEPDWKRTIYRQKTDIEPTNDKEEMFDTVKNIDKKRTMSVLYRFLIYSIKSINFGPF